MNINEREKNQIIQKKKKKDETKKQFAKQRNKCNNHPVRLITKMSKGNKNKKSNIAKDCTDI